MATEAAEMMVVAEVVLAKEVVLTVVTVVGRATERVLPSNHQRDCC